MLRLSRSRTSPRSRSSPTFTCVTISWSALSSSAPTSSASCMIHSLISSLASAGMGVTEDRDTVMNASVDRCCLPPYHEEWPPWPPCVQGCDTEKRSRDIPTPLHLLHLLFRRPI